MIRVLIPLIFAISINLPAIPALQDKAASFTLDNGLRVAAKDVPGSGLVAIQMWVRGGLLAEGEYLGSGISHFIEHMLFKGTGKRPPGKIAEEVHALGGEINAATSMDFTYYKITLPKEHFNKGLEILADAIMNPGFDEEEFKRERDVILKEINMGRDEPFRKLWHMFLGEAFITHPFREPVIGRRDFFETLTREDLAAFHRSRYTPRQMVLSVGGEVDFVSLKKAVQDYFGDWKPARNFTIPSFREPKQLSGRRKTEYFDGEKAYLRMGFHIPGIEDEDVYALDLLAFIVGSGNASRLYSEIKEKAGLADTISAFSYTPFSEGIFAIDAVTDPENLGALESAILEELEKVKMGGVGEEEIKRAKKGIASSHNLSQEKAEGVAADIGYNQLILGDADFSEYYLNRIKEVDKSEIKDAARKFLRKENLTVCSLTPEKKEFQKTAREKKERAVSRRDTAGVVLLTSQNSLTPMASLNLLFKGGVIFEDKEKNGIFSLLSKCLIRSTRKKEYLELHREVETRGASLSSYSGYNSFGISMTLAKEDIEWGIDTIASLLREPLFKEEDVEKAKEELEASLKMEDDDILTRAFYLFRETMFAQHPYAWRDKGTFESVRLITKEDIVSIYKKFCLNQKPVFAVFGDISEKDVLDFTEKKFGFLKSGRDAQFKKLPHPGEFPCNKTMTLPREQAILVFGFPGVSVNDEDRFVIEVLTTLLSGQSGRLFTAVREKKGDAYYVGAFQITGLVPGAIVFYAGTTPQKIAEVKTTMENEIEKLKQVLITDSELRKAKEILIGERRISLQGNGPFAFDAAINELYGLGFDFYLRYEQNIRKIDMPKVKEAANKYFNMEEMSWVTINPQI